MSFTSDIKNFSLKFDKANEKTMRSTTIKLWGSIIMASPTDTGRFRANWFSSDLTPSEKKTDDKDKNKGNGTTVGRATKAVRTQKNWRAFTLTNNLPYAEVIEFGGYPNPPKDPKGKTEGGFSKQAPTGVLRVNVKGFRKLMEEEARKNKV